MVIPLLANHNFTLILLELSNESALLSCRKYIHLAGTRKDWQLHHHTT